MAGEDEKNHALHVEESGKRPRRRGRCRREHFTIFKKGSKGVSYVCAVKRKFRVPGQTFADSIGALISFIESHPMVKASALPVKFLNIQLPPQPEGETNAPIEHVL